MFLSERSKSIVKHPELLSHKIHIRSWSHQPPDDASLSEKLTEPPSLSQRVCTRTILGSEWFLCRPADEPTNGRRRVGYY